VLETGLRRQGRDAGRILVEVVRPTGFPAASTTFGS